MTRLMAGYRSGRTVYELTDEFKIARQTVSEHLHHQGVPMRRQGLTDAQVTEAIRLRKQGLELNAIGDSFDVRLDTIRDRLRSRGLVADLPLR